MAAGPLAVLSRWLERYQAGDRSARVPIDSLKGKAETSLGHAFNSMADEVAGLEHKLDRFLETRAEFVSLVSHELRTPLTAIGGYVKLLLAGDTGELSVAQREFLSIVDTNVERLAHLVSDILDVEKMESGKIQVDRESVDLAAVLGDCRKTFLPLAMQKGLALELDDPGECRVLGDSKRLTQVFMNLISNAIKYTAKGSVRLELRASEHAVVARVKDTGLGMRPDEVAHLFQKFYRTRSGLTSSEVGTGLGLFLADRLVRAHGGTIAVESVPGAGTTFEVTLPVMRRSAEAANEDESRDLGELRVWLFDPDPAAVERITSVLETSASPDGRRIGVRAFARAEEVIGAEIPGGAPELIVLDPRAASYDLAAVTRLRKQAGRGVPILVVSDSLDTAVSFAEGSSAMLTKPIDDRELLIAMRDLLQASPRRVLIVDSARDFRMLLRRELEERGLRVDELERGPLGSALAAQDLAIVDDPELVREIRSRKDLASLPVLLVVSGEAGALARGQGARIGAAGVLEKRQGVGAIVAQALRELERGSK